ncbi:MAG: type II secretion system F family protein [Acidimicrobiia bacterium]
MRAVAVAFAAASVFLMAPGRRPASLTDSLSLYLRPQARVEPPRKRRAPSSRLRQAGLDWTRPELTARRVIAVVSGALVGALLAQGDLFLAGSGRSLPSLVAVGAAAGLLGLNIWITSRRERRAATLKQELPTVADSLALHVLSGESVAAAIERFIIGAGGVAADELQRVVDSYRKGMGLPEALARAGRETAEPEAARLYNLLGHAHLAGGQLADALTGLATDFRAALSRELTVEGGRRALAIYGPILALMIPVTLLFLMYPTLAGLQGLSSGP